MLSAIRASDNKKVEGRYIRKRLEEKYFCPECGAQVIHHRSDAGIVIGHFKHKAGSPFCSYEGESELHMAIKEQISIYLEEQFSGGIQFIETEYRGLGESLRPDVFLKTKKGKHIGIEVQVSPIGIDEISRRTEQYKKFGVYMLWVLPWEEERFTEEKQEFGWIHDEGQYVRRKHQVSAKHLRLSDHEVFLYWSAFKKLIFWDIDNPGFILCELGETYTAEREYLKEGEQKKHNSTKTSMIKSIERIEADIPFSSFRPSYVRAFRSRMRPYPIPARLMMLCR